MAQSDYTTNNVALLRDVVDRADTRVKAQLTTAIAADQRAMTFAGLLAAAAALLGGAAAGVLTAPTANHALGFCALWAALVTMVSMALTIWAARPTRFYSPGSKPSDWIGDIQKDTSAAEQCAALLDDYNDRIEKNEASMRRNGQTVTVAACVLIVGYLVCGIAAVA